MIVKRIHKSNRRRPAMTLVELLVVVFIVMLLTAITIPVVAPAMQSRRMREATDLLDTFIKRARGRAIESQSPVGVMLERVPGLHQACTTVSLAMVPPPYGGDTLTSRVRIMQVPRPDLVPAPGTTRRVALIPQGDVWLGYVREGDLIKFNYRGHEYRLRQVGTPPAVSWDIGFGVDGDSDGLDLDPTTDQLTMFSDTAIEPLGWPPVDVPYQIFRQPVKSATRTLQLPEGIVIDLEASSVGDVPAIDPRINASPPTDLDDVSYDLFYPRDENGVGAVDAWAQTQPVPLPLPPQVETALDLAAKPVIIMFDADGALDRVYHHVWIPGDPGRWDWRGEKPKGPVHLMLGARENILIQADFGMQATPDPAQLDDADAWRENWRDLENRWISIDDKSGNARISEVAISDEVAGPNRLDVLFPAADQRLPLMIEGIRRSRQFALERSE